MGYVTEFNWVLKLKPEQGLDEEKIEVGNEYRFFKKDNRVYPLGKQIMLVNKDWIAVGMVTISEYKNDSSGTSGSYSVKDVFNEEEKLIITKKLLAR